MRASADDARPALIYLPSAQGMADIIYLPGGACSRPND